MLTRLVAGDPSAKSLTFVGLVTDCIMSSGCRQLFDLTQLKNDKCKIGSMSGTNPRGGFVWI